MSHYTLTPGATLDYAVEGDPGYLLEVMTQDVYVLAEAGEEVDPGGVAPGVAPVITRQARLTAPPIAGLPLALRLGAAIGTPAPASTVTLERETAYASDVYEDITGEDETYVLGATEHFRKIRATVTWTNDAGSVSSVVTSSVAAIPAPRHAAYPFLAPSSVYQTTDESTPVTTGGQSVQRVTDPAGGVSLTNASSAVTWGTLGGLVYSGTGQGISAAGRTPVNDAFAYVFISERGNVARRQLFHTVGASNQGLRIESESLERVRVFPNSTTDLLLTAGGGYPIGAVSSQVIMQSTGTFGKTITSDGVTVTDATAGALSGTTITTHLGALNGTSSTFEGTIYHYAEYGPSELDVTNADHRAALNAWSEAMRDAVNEARVIIQYPTEYTAFQRQSSLGGGEVRARGTCNAVLAASGIEARWNGGAWQDCTVDDDTWSIDYVASADGTGDLEVRYKNLAHTATTPLVSVGHVYGVAGQSNAGDQAINFQDGSAHIPALSMFERRQTAATPIEPGGNNNGWNRARSKSWLPVFMDQRATDVSKPCATVRCADGSTEISKWQPGLAPNFDDENLFDAFTNAVIRSQGLESWTPASGVKLGEFVMWQQGETDASQGTPRATYTALLLSFSRAVYAAIGMPVYASRLQNLPSPSYADPLDVEVIRGAIDDAVSQEAADALAEGRPVTLYAGPDFSDVTLDGDGVHWDSDVEMAQQATRWETNTPDERP